MSTDASTRSDDTEALERALGPLPADTQAIKAVEDSCQVPTYAKYPIALVRGEGSWVEDADGKRYLDLYGGHAVALTGHCHPRVVAALRAQAGRLLFYSNMVYSDVRALAVEQLTGIAPEGLRSVFLCSSGAEANECALKIARKHTSRMRVVSMNEGFHGRTLGALGATGIAGYRDDAYPIPTQHDYVPYGDADVLAETLSDDVAAVILEPIPSMGGIRVADDAYFRALRSLCDEHGALLIFDEVQTGFGRTGRMFFGDHVGVTPDLITGAKGLASGVPAGVVFVREDLSQQIAPGEQGTTFGGGPMAAAAIAATVAVIVDEDLPTRAGETACALWGALDAVPGVESVAGRGLLLGINLDRPAKPIVRGLVEAGVLTGTCGGNPNQIRILAPLTLSQEEALGWIPTLERLLAEEPA
ncbi:MAG: aminotransferase class III-fold pyridoxal phosphate-dependent enzyme [Planctomycetota bacterium]|nr:aminotransferase class III-fold pyridoxal phosphate-dependent enzyme [Planctomycetota bacterium]